MKDNFSKRSNDKEHFLGVSDTKFSNSNLQDKLLIGNNAKIVKAFEYGSIS